jgi:diguanylate cyclase
MVKGAGLVHKEYNQNLQRQSDAMAGATDLTEVKQIVSSLVADTRRVLEENKNLENKLADSSHEIQGMRQDMQTLKQESLTDVLTGTPNRKSFDLELKARATEALDKGRPLSLIMIDIDHFKVFNDTFGHQVGDQVLRLVARTLAEGLKPSEMLARYGGEEFSVIVPSAKLRDAEKLAEKLRERIAAKDIINQSKNEKLGRLSISLGVAQLHPGEPLDNLIDRSDRALYRAKGAGRNTVIAIEYDAKLHSTAHTADIVIDADH